MLLLAPGLGFKLSFAASGVCVLGSMHGSLNPESLSRVLVRLSGGLVQETVSGAEKLPGQVHSGLGQFRPAL